MKNLSSLEQRHLLLSKQMLQADGGKLFAVDLYAVGSIKRSMAHYKGFVTLIKTKNLTCAGGIIRMQLDTLLRFYAVFLVDDPHAFASSVMGGKPVNKHTDRDGELMHDAYLVKRLSKEYPWIKNVYKETSGYVHFSFKHIFSAVRHLEEEDRKIHFMISAEDVERAEKYYDEAVDAFGNITEIFLHYLEGWVITKTNSEIIEKVINAKPPHSPQSRDRRRRKADKR